MYIKSVKGYNVNLSDINVYLNDGADWIFVNDEDFNQSPDANLLIDFIQIKKSKKEQSEGNDDKKLPNDDKSSNSKKYDINKGTIVRDVNGVNDKIPEGIFVANGKNSGVDDTVNEGGAEEDNKTDEIGKDNNDENDTLGETESVTDESLEPKGDSTVVEPSEPTLPEDSAEGIDHSVDTAALVDNSKDDKVIKSNESAITAKSKTSKDTKVKKEKTSKK